VKSAKIAPRRFLIALIKPEAPGLGGSFNRG
jgi:hypothetical protein